jgi:hypothetical protein
VHATSQNTVCIIYEHIFLQLLWYSRLYHRMGRHLARYAISAEMIATDDFDCLAMLPNRHRRADRAAGSHAVVGLRIRRGQDDFQQTPPALPPE